MERDLSNLTIVGNSFGGAVALLLALKLSEEEPKRISKLILIDSAGDKHYLPRYLKVVRSRVGGFVSQLIPMRLATKFVLKACYYDRRKITQDQVAAYLAPFHNRGGRHAFLQTAKQCIPPDVDELMLKLKSIGVPTYIIWGREDQVLPLRVGELLQETIPNSTLEVIDECGHIPQEEKPSETVRLLENFLAAP
jgi:pimeloyl-ACP methyl ester carboxylesterase